MEKIKPAFVGKLRDRLAKAFPGVVTAPSFSVDVVAHNDRKLTVTDKDAYRISMPTSGSGRPNLDVVVFQQTFGDLVRQGIIKPEDVINHPDLLKGDQAQQDRQKKSLEQACVIAVQAPGNGISSLRRIYVMDGLRHKSLTCTFCSAVGMTLDLPSPEVISKKMRGVIEHHTAREQAFNTAVRPQVIDNLKNIPGFLAGAVGSTVTKADFFPASATHKIEVDVKRSGFIGGLAKLFGASAAGTYRLNLKVMSDSYQSLLEQGVLTKDDVINRAGLKEQAGKIADPERRQDFMDEVKSAPVVEIGMTSAVGPYVKKYVVLPKGALFAGQREEMNHGLLRFMKDTGPTVASP